MQPVLFESPMGVSIHSYGAFLCLSVVVGRMLALRLAARDGLDPEQMSRCCVVTLVAALVGARVLNVATNPGAFGSAFEALAWWKGGVVAYGGFLGGLLGSVWFCRRRGIPLLAWADCAAPSLCIGLLLTRIGCFLAGCDYGVPSAAPWGVRFPAASPAFAEHVRLGLVPSAAAASLPVHPTQLYEALSGAILLAMVTAVRARGASAGRAFAAFAAGYGVLRFLIECVRGDPGRGAVGPFSTSQFIALASVLAAAALVGAARGRSTSGGSCLA